MFILLDDGGYWNLDHLVQYRRDSDGYLTLVFATGHVRKLNPDHSRYAVVAEHIASLTPPS